MTTIDFSNALQQFGTQHAPLADMAIDKNMYDSFLGKYANSDFLTKFINVCLYQSDFTAIAGINNNTEIIQYFKTFLKSLNDDVKGIKTVSINTPTKPFLDTITFINSLLSIKDDPTARLINYDSIHSHFQNLNPYTKQIISNASTNRIANFQVFKSELEDINKLIGVYHELKQVKFISEELDILKTQVNNNDISPLNLLKTYKEIINKAHNVFSTLKSVNSDDESSKYLEFYDESDAGEVADKLLKFLSNSFNFFASGYELFDKHLDGIESSSVYVISAASNNGKSLFMINLMRSVIINKLNEFEPNDMILFVTLEDDIYKLYRRIISIFGNYNPKLCKKLFVYSSQLLKGSGKGENNKDIIYHKGLESQIKALLEKITNQAIHSVTKGRCKVGILHSNEFGYNMADASAFIDKQRALGVNVKMAFIDYIDCMLPSNMASNAAGKEYDTQGVVVQEMKLVGREQGVSIISVTQNSKLAENSQQALNNSLIGDSLTYSDLIGRPMLNNFSNSVKLLAA